MVPYHSWATGSQASREAPFLGKRAAGASVWRAWRVAERLDLRRAILRLARLPSFWFRKRPLLMERHLKVRNAESLEASGARFYPFDWPPLSHGG